MMDHWIAAPVTRQCHPDIVQVELIEAKMPPTMKIIIKTGIEISVRSPATHGPSDAVGVEIERKIPHPSYSISDFEK